MFVAGLIEIDITFPMDAEFYELQEYVPNLRIEGQNSRDVVQGTVANRQCVAANELIYLLWPFPPNGQCETVSAGGMRVTIESLSIEPYSRVNGNSWSGEVPISEGENHISIVGLGVNIGVAIR